MFQRAEQYPVGRVRVRIEEWPRLIRDLSPDRLSKVRAMRRAIRRKAYDTGEALERTVRVLQDRLAAT